MIPSIIGTKIKQSRLFTPEGKSIPVTYIRVEPLRVVQVKTQKTDGYTAVQIGIGSQIPRRISKPIVGHIKKAGMDAHPPRFLREVRMYGGQMPGEGTAPGNTITVSQVLGIGDVVTVTGTSKGKGFAGVVKRHHFRGGPRTHGQSDRERAPGSIGQTTTPGRVYKGKRMAGRMGNDRVTVKNLRVFAVDDEKQTLTVSGLVPGARNSLVIVRKI